MSDRRDEKDIKDQRKEERRKSFLVPEVLSVPSTQPGFIPPHGGYQNLLSYQKSQIVYDATVYFCSRFLDKRDRTYDQMIQAARSGKQNIIEGSQASGTSREMEIKLTNVA